MTPWRVRLATLATVVASLIGSGLIVWQASYSAFSKTTANSGNSWTAGSVTITDDDGGSAAFTVALAKPDGTDTALAPPSSGAYTADSTSQGGSACIKVTYSGTLTANIHLYASLTETGDNGGLGQFLLFSIDTGTDTAPGTDLACSTFTTSTSYIFGSSNNSTTQLADSAATDYASGWTGWDGATATTSKWYRFSWLLPNGVSDNAQAQQVQATFTWEAQNT